MIKFELWNMASQLSLSQSPYFGNHLSPANSPGVSSKLSKALRDLQHSQVGAGLDGSDLWNTHFTVFKALGTTAPRSPYGPGILTGPRSWQVENHVLT